MQKPGSLTACRVSPNTVVYSAQATQLANGAISLTRLFFYGVMTSHSCPQSQVAHCCWRTSREHAIVNVFSTCTTSTFLLCLGILLPIHVLSMHDSRGQYATTFPSSAVVLTANGLCASASQKFISQLSAFSNKLQSGIFDAIGPFIACRLHRSLRSCPHEARFWDGPTALRRGGIDSDLHCFLHHVNCIHFLLFMLAHGCQDVESSTRARDSSCRPAS